MGQLIKLFDYSGRTPLTDFSSLQFGSNILTLDQIALIQNDLIARIILDNLWNSPQPSRSYTLDFLDSKIRKQVPLNLYLGPSESKSNYGPFPDTVNKLAIEKLAYVDRNPGPTSRHWRAKRRARIYLDKGFYPETTNGKELRKALDFYSKK